MLTFSLSIRDPLHGYIDLTQQEVDILNSSPLQRLRRIRQLPNVDLVYPGANHSRFEHSLGMLFIADKIAENLDLTEDLRRIIRCSALLHDTGHGPFSHEFEDATKKITGKEISHEDITYRIINEVPEIENALGDQHELVLSLFKDDKYSIAGQIISGGLDADKMDYFLRDSYYTGVTYGIFDLHRILHTITTASLGPEKYLAIEEKGIDALDSFRLARFMMHSQVYYHHTRVIANRMLERGMEIAVRDGLISLTELDINHDRFLKNFMAFDDAHLLIKLQENPGSKAAVFAGMLKERKLLKRGYEMNASTCRDLSVRMKLIKKNQSFDALENAIAEECHCDPDMIIAEQHEVENSLLASSYRRINDNDPPYLIRDKAGIAHQIEEISSINAKSEPRLMFYIFCPQEYQATVHACAESLIKQFL